jgi:hypothetical protein
LSKEANRPIIFSRSTLRIRVKDALYSFISGLGLLKITLGCEELYPRMEWLGTLTLIPPKMPLE